MNAALTYEDIVKERERHNEEYLKALESKRIFEQQPNRYKVTGFDDFIVSNKNQEMVRAVVKRYVETFNERSSTGSGLFLVGSCGTGKTLLARIIEKALRESGFRVQYESNLIFLRKLKDTQFESYAAFKTACRPYEEADLLIVDEITEGFFGKTGELSDWEKQMLFSVIDARYREKKCTVVISNREHSDIQNRIGNRSYDRLIEGGLTLAFNWHSYRSTNQGEQHADPQ